MRRYRKNNSTRSNEPRTLVTKFAGKCACCSGDIAAGQYVWWVPGRGIYHSGNFDRDGKFTANSGYCASEASKKIVAAAAHRDPGEDAADRWNETHR